MPSLGEPDLRYICAADIFVYSQDLAQENVVFFFSLGYK